MSTIKWQCERALQGYRVYARSSRSEIIVRVENEGDTSRYAEWGMPKSLGVLGAMDQAALQTRPDDIKE